MEKADRHCTKTQTTERTNNAVTRRQVKYKICIGYNKVCIDCLKEYVPICWLKYRLHVQFDEKVKCDSNMSPIKTLNIKWYKTENTYITKLRRELYTYVQLWCENNFYISSCVGLCCNLVAVFKGHRNCGTAFCNR